MQQNHNPQYNPDRADAQERTRLLSLGAGGAPLSGEFKPGDWIGESYEVLRWIGAGGMGNVYCVRHTIMQADYALKTLSADQVTEVAWRRFQNEAQAIARMSHPNIVAIFNLGLHDGRLPYYVMDLLKGQSLADLLRDRGPMEVNKTLALFIELAAGLGYAHKKGIVHRDIKPGNILILDVPEPSCKVKIVDFGIAKLSGVKDPQNQYLTNVGEVCGSPYYMSPEQSTGERIDARSDIYSLGCTLFEVLTGNPPLRGRSAMDTMFMHQTACPPSLKDASGGKEFPEKLEQVIATLLAKAPMDRYQTMELLSQDLSTIAAGDQSAINPFAAAPAKSRVELDRTDKSQSQTEAGEGLQHKLTGRRLYQNDGSEEEAEEAQRKEAGRSRPLRLLLACALTTAAVLGLGYGLWWRNQHDAKPTAADATVPSTSNFSEETFVNSFAEFTCTDKLIGKRDRNKNVHITSDKETNAFCHIEKTKGPSIKVFEFPTDCTIGDIRSETQRDVPAKGKRVFSIDAKVEFWPDKFLSKYPGYLSRFRSGDIYSLKLTGREATNELFRLTYDMPGIQRLHFEECPNITAQIVPLIDKMPGLKDLQLDGETISSAALSHLTCLKNLVSMSLRSKTDADSFLKLVKDSDKLSNLTVSHCTVSHQGFKYMATLTKLRRLSLEDSKFTSSDLQVLAYMPKLEGICLEADQVDQGMAACLRKIKSLKTVEFGKCDPRHRQSIWLLASKLTGVNVTFLSEGGDTVPALSTMHE